MIFPFESCSALPECGTKCNSMPFFKAVEFSLHIIPLERVGASQFVLSVCCDGKA